MIKTDEEAKRVLKHLSETLFELETPSETNIFDAIGMSTQEVKHSAFLAWLFNPQKPHKNGNLFLIDFLKSLYEYKNDTSNVAKSNAEILNMPLQELLDIFSADDITVETEKVIDKSESRIDIFIESKKSNAVIVIENKIFTSTHDDQLNRYEKEVEKLNNDGKLKKIFVYLTPFGDIPTDINENYQEHWCIIDYGTIVKNIKSRTPYLKDNKLKYLTEDYVDMINDKILHNNPTIRSLCKKIRREHAEALEILLNYIDNVDTVLRHIATEWLPKNVPDTSEFIYSGRKLAFVTDAIKSYYSNNGVEMPIGNGIFKFQISVASKDGPVNMVMCLYKNAEDEWTDADRKIRDILQPQKNMGDKYCTLYTCSLLTVEEREKVFNDKELLTLIDDRLKVFYSKLRYLENQLKNL